MKLRYNYRNNLIVAQHSSQQKQVIVRDEAYCLNVNSVENRANKVRKVFII